MEKDLISLFDRLNAEHIAEYGKEPLFATCGIVFNGSNRVETMVFKLSTKVVDSEDNEIFFYCNGADELKSLCEKDNGEDFQIVDIYDVFDEI